MRYHEGEKVVIKSVEEIRDTLDQNGCLHNVFFADEDDSFEGMCGLCGKTVIIDRASMDRGYPLYYAEDWYWREEWIEDADGELSIDIDALFEGRNS